MLAHRQGSQRAPGVAGSQSGQSFVEFDEEFDHSFFLHRWASPSAVRGDDGLVSRNRNHVTFDRRYVNTRDS